MFPKQNLSTLSDIFICKISWKLMKNTSLKSEIAKKLGTVVPVDNPSTQEEDAGR